MVKLRWILVLLIIAGLAVAGYYLLKPTEEKRIRKRFAQLTGLLDKVGDEGTFVTAGKAKAIADLFTDPVQIAGLPFDLGGAYGHQELMGLVVQGRARFQALDADLHDLEIVLEDETSAASRFTARLTGRVSGESLQEVREVMCGLRKQDDEWFIARVEMVEIMRK